MPNQILALAVSAIAFTASGATLSHNYNLASSLSDLLGGPALVSGGGTITSSGYIFAANQELSLSSGLADPANYSVLFDFSFSILNGFRKQLDFKDRTSDQGLYDFNSQLDFFNFASGPAAFIPDVLARVVLTRDSTTNLVTGYVNGTQQLQFADNTSAAVFSGTNNRMRFFIDDPITGQNEASAGRATRIRIYNGALTSAEVSALGGPEAVVSGVPEPSSLALLVTGALGIALAKLRRK